MRVERLRACAAGVGVGVGVTAGMTVVVAVDELLDGSISTDALTIAVLLKVAATVGLTTMMIVALPGIGRSKLQVIVLVPSQVPSLGVTET